MVSRVPPCTADQALAFFQELQDGVQDCLLRALQQVADGEVASGLHGADAAHAAAGGCPAKPAADTLLEAAAASREAAGAELAAMLDGSGGLRDASVAGKAHDAAGGQRYACCPSKNMRRRSFALPLSIAISCQQQVNWHPSLQALLWR